MAEEAAGGLLLLAAAAVVCVYAAFVWATQGAPAATKVLQDARRKVDVAFSDDEPSDVEPCPLSGTREVDPNGENPPGLPPGGAPEPPIDITLPIIAIAVGVFGSETNKPFVKPSTLSEQDSKLWDECTAMHDTYKNTQGDLANRASRIKALIEKTNNGQATPQDKIDLCGLLEEQIDTAQRLHRERRKYVDSDCDKFDWSNNGSTPEERKDAHEGEISNVDKQIANLYALKKRYCP